MTSAPTYQAKLYSSDNWKRRRWFMISFLGFNSFWISYILWYGQDTQLNRDTAGTMLFANAGVIMSYVFGAVADDWDKRKKLDPPPAEDPIPPNPPTGTVE